MFDYKTAFYPVLFLLLIAGLLVGCDESLPTSSLDSFESADSEARTQTPSLSSTIPEDSSATISGHYIVVFHD